MKYEHGTKKRLKRTHLGVIDDDSSALDSDPSIFCI